MAVYQHGGLLATYYPYPSTYAFVYLYTIYVVIFTLKPTNRNLTMIIIAYSLIIMSYLGAFLVSFPLVLYLLTKRGFFKSKYSIFYKLLFSIMIVGGVILFVIYRLYIFMGIPIPTGHGIFDFGTILNSRAPCPSAFSEVFRQLHSGQTTWNKKPAMICYHSHPFPSGIEQLPDSFN